MIYHLTSNAKLFANDTSLFSVVHDSNTSVKKLNDDWKKLMIGLSNESYLPTQEVIHRPTHL